MLNLFGTKKDKSLVKINQHLHFAFSKLDSDISNVQMWIHHLKEKGENIETSHKKHIELTQRDIDQLNKWIHFLNNHNLELQRYLKELTSHIITLQGRDEALSEKVNSLESRLKEISSSLDMKMSDMAKKVEKGHLGTTDGTIKGHLEDVSSAPGTQKQVSLVNPAQVPAPLPPRATPLATAPVSNALPILPVEEIKVVEPSIAVSKSTLTGSQIELLRVLYEADRPLSYNEMAKVLGKKGKSIRNLIYEIRDAGIPVESRFVGLRKRGFYLTKDSKIRLTGR